MATISRVIAASETTTRNIYNNANRFAGNNRTYAEMTATAQAENLQVRNGMINAMSYSMPGINNARSIVQWAFNEKTEKGTVADQIFEADDMYIVAALKDVYKVGYASLDQVRNMIENQVRIEKKADNNGDMQWQLDGNYGFLNEDIVNTPEGGAFATAYRSTTTSWASTVWSPRFRPPSPLPKPTLWSAPSRAPTVSICST